MSTDRPRTVACDLDPDGHCNTHGGRHIEPAAAEPPEPDAVYGDWQQDLIALFNEVTALRLQRPRLLARIERLERAAQPPRGSLPDRQAATHRAVYSGNNDDKTVRELRQGLAAGSLTATEPPANLTWTYSGKCPNCGHDITAELPSLPADSDPPRGVTPALDVERVRQTITNLRDAWAGDDDPAAAFIAEYARLGSTDGH